MLRRGLVWRREEAKDLRGSLLLLEVVVCFGCDSFSFRRRSEWEKVRRAVVDATVVRVVLRSDGLDWNSVRICWSRKARRQDLQIDILRGNCVYSGARQCTEMSRLEQNR